jgi:hypothetical protein
MTSAYEFDISRATRAADLHAYTADIRTDETLTLEEKDELHKLIRAQFARLNLAAAQNRKPRW